MWNASDATIHDTPDPKVNSFTEGFLEYTLLDGELWRVEDGGGMRTRFGIHGTEVGKRLAAWQEFMTLNQSWEVVPRPARRRRCCGTAHATTLAQSFEPGGLLQRDARESTETVYRGISTGQVSQFSKVSFSYSFHLAAVSGSIQYAPKSAENIEAREITTSWAADEASADALITALLSGATGRAGTDERTSNWDKGATDARRNSLRDRLAIVVEGRKI